MYEDVKTKMKKAMASLENDFAAIRAGRANPALLDKITVDYYGTPTPIPQIGSVSVPEARMLVIQPWDASILGEIEKAILKSDLGITPNNDGKMLRLNFPALTEDRRKELAKGISKRAEEAKVVIRGVRRDAIEAFKAQKKKGEITEDDFNDDEAAKKDNEIMEI